ncbi:hypothetical protein F511_16044 [Dorcoceras hygrometricum]|uniref:Uncharacterized protein n=1 Tax=Dorcoceras hygrometricum TaxID=472368 RepID=A0A2Z7BDX7_9LAMI|nr:hypothetical protein F511_16044 [Dorcoceras hygrometricum]
MRIRPPEFETSICDAKYHVSLSTRSVLGKCVYLVTLVMSLFDLQDVRIAIGSIATLDLPMVVDLIGIYGLKGPYCTLTTTDWFLQALSVIPRGSWGDVARRFTMIRWADSRTDTQLNVLSTRRGFWEVRLPESAAADLRRKFVSGQFDEENLFVQNSSVLLVQPDEGVLVLVVDRIGDYLPQSTEKSRVLLIPVGARHKCQQENENRESTNGPPPHAAAPSYHAHERARHARRSRKGGERWPQLHVRRRAGRAQAVARVAGRRWRMGARACRAASRTRCANPPGPSLLVARPVAPLVRWMAARRLLEMSRDRWLDEARWLRTMRAGRATLRAASCTAAAIFVVAAPPSPAAAPACLRRCRDGWSEFF